MQAVNRTNILFSRPEVALHSLGGIYFSGKSTLKKTGLSLS